MEEERKESLSFKTEDGLKLQVLEPKREVGLIVVITGNGKGKTTTALGIVLRAAGHGLRVCMIEFMKGDIYAGEIDGVKKLAPNVSSTSWERVSAGSRATLTHTGNTGRTPRMR